jgi:hypothetical protein
MDVSGSDTKSNPVPLGTRATNGYHNYSETIQILTDLETNYPNVVRKYDLSQRYPHFNGSPKLTTYGNRLWAVKISDNPILEEKNESKVLYLGLHHSREWITVEACIYMAKHLAMNYNTNTTVKKMVDENEIWILPVVNPDGFIYSHEQDDINKSNGAGGWRKNRQETNGVAGFQNFGGASGDGVDLNRNYGYQWGYDNSGSSPSKNDSTYRGPAAFSEIETQIVRDLSLDRQFNTAISFHSHGEVILFPWAYKDADTPHHAVFMELGEEMALHNGYIYGNPRMGVLYNANGEWSDWMYSSAGTYAFTYELATVFIPPKGQIQSICKANAEAAFIVAKYASDPYSLFESALEGVVKDTRGNPIEGAVITTKFVNDTFETTSDVDGKYTLRLPDASYSVTTEREGYETRILTGVNVPKKAMGTLNIVLKDIVPPELKEVRTSLELIGDENHTTFNAGDRVVILVRDSENDKDLTGFAVVNSTSQGYVSSELLLSYSSAVNGYYAYWYTEGLHQSDDYRIDAVMTDYDGNTNFNGSNETGADLVVTLLDVTPPVVSSVNSYINTLQSEVFELGTSVRIEVKEKSLEPYLTGTIHIVENNLGYSSGLQDLVFDIDRNIYFWTWETAGLKPSLRYEVHTTLKDRWGNEDTEGLRDGADLKIKLVDNMPPYITKVDSSVGSDNDEVYPIGTTIKLMVFEYDNESGLNGNVFIRSPDLPGSYSEQLELVFDSESNYYYTHWNTIEATPFIDYYFEAYLVDKYNNSDSDGSESFGPDLVVQLTDFVPPIIGTVSAYKNSHFHSLEVKKTAGSGLEPETKFETHEIIRIVVNPEILETDLVGYINISSISGNYDITNLELKFDPIFSHYFTTWDTSGLIPSDDYIINAVLGDVYGNADRDGLKSGKADLTLTLADTTPPEIMAISILSRSTGLAVTDTVELGDELEIMITVRVNEMGLIGKINIKSASNEFDSGMIEVHYNTTGAYYWNTFSTAELKVGTDYELEAFFSDRYNNLDSDGLKSGPDFTFIFEDTTPPESVDNLAGHEDIDVKGTINLEWEPVESNASVLIYRSAEEIFSISNAEHIATINDVTQVYFDPVGANGKTYYYILVVKDENGNADLTITSGNSVSVTVTKLEDDVSSMAVILLIAALAAVVVVVSVILLFKKRSKKVELNEKVNGSTDDDLASELLEEGEKIDSEEPSISADELYKEDYK